MAMTQTITGACTATTAAGTNTLKAEAIALGTVNAVMAAMSKAGPITVAQQQAVAALRAHITASAATVRIAIYGA